jgi:hypothetical protein
VKGALDDVVIEEVPIVKPRTSPWLVLGIIGVILALFFGVRTVQKQRRRRRPATPTGIPPVENPPA